MEPLDQYSAMQPLVQNEITQALQTYDSNNQQNVSPVSYHTHSGNDAPQISFLDLTDKRRYILYRALDSATNATVGTVGGDFVMPFSGKLLDCGATVDTAGTTNSMTVDIDNGGTTVMANSKIAIASAAKTSRGSTTPPAITTPAFKTGDIFTFEIDAIHTTPAKGLTVFMVVTEA